MSRFPSYTGYLWLFGLSLMLAFGIYRTGKAGRAQEGKP